MAFRMPDLPDEQEDMDALAAWFTRRERRGRTGTKKNSGSSVEERGPVMRFVEA